MSDVWDFIRFDNAPLESSVKEQPGRYRRVLQILCAFQTIYRNDEHLVAFSSV